MRGKEEIMKPIGLILLLALGLGFATMVVRAAVPCA
jgi:hypothetical protein